MDYGFVVVHVPHASVNIPPRYRRGMLLDDGALAREMVAVTDAFCNELYNLPGIGEMITAPVSRLVCDMERFRDDEKEPCVAKGQGLLYTHTIDGKRLRENCAALREEVLDKFYDPHHRRLTAAVDKALEKYGKCLIIDGHSFLVEGADFDIGTDGFHTPAALRDGLCERVEARGFSWAVNSPYAGTMVPMKHYGKDRRVASVMIETNRRLYQVPGKLEKNGDFEKIRDLCHELMRTAAALFVAL